jgi:2-polyprenyl-3-methyl-5-hydroxy-6-metoxy-1,4-benzoquinol methylase
VPQSAAVDDQNTADPRHADDATRAYAFRVWSFKQGEVVALMIHLGDRLGLYRTMAGAGRLTADALAERTGLDRRWLLEWLRSQAAAGLVVTTDGEVFELPAEAGPVLADEEGSVWFAAGAFPGCVAPPEVVDRLAQAFRTGRGLSYEDLGPSGAQTIERMLAPWSRVALVPVVLAGIGVTPRLRTGARVADVGCGSGVALASMAQAFPASTVDGYDPSGHAVARARARIEELGLSNVELFERPAEDLPAGPTYELIVTLDCLHDMPHPDGAAAAVRRALSDDGVWLIKEVRAGVSWAENQRNPMLAMMYGTSVATCLSSATSEPGGAGLGTLGLDPVSLEELCRGAGFTRFDRHDFGDPANLYYAVRP